MCVSIFGPCPASPPKRILNLIKERVEHIGLNPATCNCESNMLPYMWAHRRTKVSEGLLINEII